MVEETIRAGRPRNQNIMLENRKKMSITGVLDVLRFADTNIIMKTDLGQLVVKGSALRIIKLDLDNTLVEIEGLVDNIDYSGKGGVFGKSGNSLFGKNVNSTLGNSMLGNSGNSVSGKTAYAEQKSDKTGIFNKNR